MTVRLTLTYHGIELEVVGSCYKYRPATHYQPAEGGDFEIDEVLHRGEDISDLLDIDELAIYCYRHVVEMAEAAQEDYAYAD